MIGIWVWRAQLVSEFKTHYFVSVPMIGIWVWRAVPFVIPIKLLPGFSPDDRDLGLARYILGSWLSLA